MGVGRDVNFNPQGWGNSDDLGQCYGYYAGH